MRNGIGCLQNFGNNANDNNMYARRTSSYFLLNTCRRNVTGGSIARRRTSVQRT